MRKLILRMSISLDGFVGGPNGEIDWIFRSFDDEMNAWEAERVWRAGVHAMGSRTFRDMAAHWPTATEPTAQAMNEIPKVVFSRRGSVDADTGGTTRAVEDAVSARAAQGGKPGARSPHAGTWTDARVMGGDLTEGIRQLKREPGKDILAHGGAGFARSLVKTGLIDEYHLLIHPVVLGRGLPIFSELDKPADLKLVSAKVFGTGAAAHTYAPR
jgi:dihydrofolate reductase